MLSQVKYLLWVLVWEREFELGKGSDYWHLEEQGLQSSHFALDILVSLLVVSLLDSGLLEPPMRMQQALSDLLSVEVRSSGHETETVPHLVPARICRVIFVFLCSVFRRAFVLYDSILCQFWIKISLHSSYQQGLEHGYTIQMS